MYQVGVSIQMSSFNLTRIVIMSPFYTLVNKSSFELEVGEVQNNNGFSNKWHYISSTEVRAELIFYQRQQYAYTVLYVCWLYNCVCYSVCLFGLSPQQGSCVHELWDLNLAPNRSSSASRTAELCCVWIRWTCSGCKHDKYTLLNHIDLIHLILIFFSISLVAW